MSGPQAAFDTINDVIAAYDLGDVQSGDVVFVIDKNSMMAVIQYPSAPDPTFIRTAYSSSTDFETDLTEQTFPTYTPGYILNAESPSSPSAIVIAGCDTSMFELFNLGAASNMRTGDNTDKVVPMNRDPNTDVNLTTNYDATALPTVDDVPQRNF